MRFSMKMVFAPDIELRMQPSERGSSRLNGAAASLNGAAAIGQQMFDWH